VILGCLIIIPLSEALDRHVSGIGVPGAITWVQHLVLWLGLFGGILATWQRRHLAIGAIQALGKKQSQHVSDFLINTGTLVFLFSLIRASAIMVKLQVASPEKLGTWLPVWLAQSAMPVAFLVMAGITVMTGYTTWQQRFLSIIVAGSLFMILMHTPETCRPLITTALLILTLALAFMGMPLFVMLGGASLLLFFSAGIPMAALPSEAYRIMTQPVLPSIPLFALSGAILAAGGAPRRIIRFVTAWTGWIRGGVAIATVIGCALFTAITGASGVTILALGGLLLPLLMAAHYDKRFSIGLLTSSGSVGLLLPPSLPVILYGIYGHVAIDRLFMAALFPGILLVFFLSMAAVYAGKTGNKDRERFHLKEALEAFWAAKGDLAIPVIIVAGFFGGILTLIETAAFTALWAILLETVFHRQLTFRHGLPKAMKEASILVGALLMVLGFAAGLMSYIIDAQIPFTITEWIIKVIQSKIIFLLALNVILLIIGMFMDIFSAIVIVVPVIVPVGIAFHIDPVHLGVIFLANLEFGYLTPPVGMNLFLSSLSFHKPLLEIWRTVIPFLGLFILWVLLITYVPFISTGVGRFFGR
jgi:C4-dicarboxylate transporter, DctM subunit